MMADADEIWHLGDVVDDSSIAAIHALNRPLLIVRGNCDHCDRWPWVIDIQREGFGVRLIHIPPSFATTGVDLLFHGHTHISRNERIENARFYNPGSVSMPKDGKKGTFAWLELHAGKAPKWELVTV